MNGVENLLDVIDEINAQAAYLKQTGDTLNLLEGAFIDDGLQSEDNFDEPKAIRFAQIFPPLFSAFSLVCREIQRISDNLTDLGCAVARLNGQKTEKDKP